MRLPVLVRRLERRARVARGFEAASRTAFWSAMIVAPLVLLARWNGWLDDSRGLTWLAVAVPIVLGLLHGVWSGDRFRLAPGTAAAWLDRRTGGTGALLTGLERPDPRWESRVAGVVDAGLADRRLRLPGVRTERPALFFGSAMLVVVLAVGLRVPKFELPSAELFAPWIERLADRLAGLEELKLDEEVVADLKQRLEQLTERLEDADTQSLYEALDRLGERIDREAEKLAASRERIDSELEAARAAAERAMAAGAADSEAMAALESLSAALAEMKAEGWMDGAAAKGLEAQLAKLESGAFDAASASGLGESMRAQVAGRFAELAKSGAFDPNKLRELAQRAADRKPGGT